MRRQIEELRQRMREMSIDICVIPTADPHGSEYVNDHFKVREFMSGFTGSAGTLVVTADFAGLWTDGRYFLQAKEELSGSGIELMRMGAEGVPSVTEYVKGLPLSMSVGFDGRVVGCSFGKELASGGRAVYDIDPAEGIWNDRPELIPLKVYLLGIEVTGRTHEEKLAELRDRMDGAEYILVSRLEDIAWLYNLRGSDVEHTPVFYAYALISETDDILYLMDGDFVGCDGENSGGLIDGSSDSLRETVIRRYGDVHDDLAALRDCSIILDEDSVSFMMAESLDDGVERIFRKSIVEEMKAVKNDVEIAATKRAHIRDGAAMVEALYRIKTDIGRKQMDEIYAADCLEERRRARGAYDISFDTIAGYEEHGAIIHYSATEESSAELRPEGFLLIDSGGQYKDGTTDITRTVALGKLDDDRRKHYTAVLKSHIALATAVFTKDTTCADLDLIARRPLRELGLDFNHGTGHGVGHMLSVHEGPQNIGPRGKEKYIVPGMITTDEPGVYFEGRYGIRIENELLCVEKDGVYAFENLTYCPYEREAIEKSMLTTEEIEWIDEYHRNVYDVLAPLLGEAEREWLLGQCRVI